jgi:hypothetical protein
MSPRRSAEPSEEALSTTVTRRGSASPRAAATEATHRRRWSPAFQLTITMSTDDVIPGR